MSTATELLSRALEALHFDLSAKESAKVAEEIRAFLAAEPEAEPVFIRPDHLALARKSPFLCQVGPVQVADFVPLYTKPEPAIRKPMTDGDLLREWQRHFYNDAWDAFEAGIRFAEKHHGISEE